MAKGSSKKMEARMKPEVVPQVRNSLERLPHGWILQIKTRSSGERAGRKYKCYFDPLSGSRFYSKAEVLRFLKSGNAYTPTSGEKRPFKASAKDNVLAQIEYSPHGLPHGWIKEIKFRKSNYKADPYYTDPVSGYVFRSLKDAIHYVETGEISKRAFRPRKRSVHEMFSLEKESPPPIPVKKLKSLRSSTRRCLFTEGASTSNGEVTVEIDASPDKLLLPPSDHASSESFQKANKNKRKVLEAANGEQKTKRGRPTIKMSQSAIKLEENGVEIDKFSDKLKLPAPDHASSKSFQNVDLISSPSIERSEGKADKKRKKGLKAPTGNSLDTGNYQEQKAKRESLPKTRFWSVKEKKISEELRDPPTVIVTTPSVSQNKQQLRAIKNKLVISPPRRSSKRLAGLDPAPVTDLVIHQPSHHSMSKDGCNGIKESVPLAEPERMDTKEKASLGEQMLFKGQTLGSSSPYPCIEFAIRNWENGSRAATDNSLDTSSYQEQKAKRKSLTKTKFRSNEDNKRSEELQEQPTMIMKTPPVSQDKKQQGAIKNKSVITLPRQLSKRLGGLKPASVTDLVIHRSSCQPVSNGGGNGTKEVVPLAESKRIDTEEKAFSGELVLMKGRTLESLSPLASLPSYEFWPDPCVEFAIKNGKNRLRAATDNLLDTSSYRELKARRGSMPKTRSRSEKEQKGVKALPEPPRIAIEKLSEPATNETTEKQQRAIKEKSVITLPTRSSKRFAGLEAALVTDLAVDCPSLQSSNSECNGIKESVLLAEPGRIYSEEKSLGEQVLFKGQTSEDWSTSSPHVSLPFCEFWQDPCIEFAVKTLMGEIPVPDEGIVIEKYVQKQLGSSVEMEKLNPSASAIADTDMTRSIGSVELLPEKKHLLGPISDEGKACPSENGLALDVNSVQKVMQMFKRLGL